jgi:hypothetical protein
LTIFSRRSREYGFIFNPLSQCFTVSYMSASRCISEKRDLRI